MARSLKHYPTEDEARQFISQEELADKIDELRPYATEVKIAEYIGDLTPRLLAAFARFQEAILGQYPDAVVKGNENTLTVSREKTYAEKEDTVLQQVRTDIYYNPDRYDVPEEWRTAEDRAERAKLGAQNTSA